MPEKYFTKKHVEMLGCSIIIFLSNYALNAWIKLQGFCMDDLYYWGVYHRSSVVEFIFNTDLNKIRPISNIFQLIGYKIVGYQTHLLDWYLLLCQFTAAMVLYCVLFKITQKSAIALGMTVVYLLSLFSYFYVGQYYGVMESVALIFAILALYYTFLFLNNTENDRKSYILATMMSLLSIFSHERYMCLFGILLLAPLLKIRNKNDIKQNCKYIFGGLFLIIITLVARVAVLGSRSFDGTGGSELFKNLDILRVIKFCLTGLASFLGINANDAYLNGISASNVSLYIYIFIVIYIISIFIVAISVFKYGGKEAKEQKSFLWKNSILFLAFIALNLGISSTTFRLELRWLYTAFTGCIILFGFWINYLLNTRKNNIQKIAIVCLIVMVFSNLPIQLYYRNYYKFIYFSGLQHVYNKLYLETLQKYGDNLYMRPIILVEEEEIFIHEQELNRFYKEYKQKPNLPSPEIYIYKHINEIPETVKNRNPVVVIVDSYNPNDGFEKQIMDITREYNYEVEKSKISQNIRNTHLVSGFFTWEEGNNQFIWTEQNCALKIDTGANGKLHLIASIPIQTAPNKISVYFNKKLFNTIAINDTNINITEQLPPNEIGELSFKLEKAYKPYELGVSQDRRTLGMVISELYCE